ncbi:MAG: DUF402 domain-containing protein [Eubacteriales bacterium]
MRIKIKHIQRSGWQRVTARRFACLPFEEKNGLSGTAALLCLDSVAAPLWKTVAGQEICIAADGYRWLQIAPENRHWWLTVMLDRTGTIFQYYFDITLENIVCGSDSYFRDLFLDVAALPGGPLELLDQDELDAALANRLISAEQYQLAEKTARVLLEELPGHWAELYEFCIKIYNHLRKELEP